MVRIDIDVMRIVGKGIVLKIIIEFSSFKVLWLLHSKLFFL
jgi:hypothetical protein